MGWINDVTDYSLAVLNQYRPKLEIYAGTGLIFGGAAYACYQTTKLGEVNAKALKRVENVHKKYEMMEVIDEKQYKMEVGKARMQQIGDIAMLYAIPTLAMGAGTGLIFDGVHQYDTRLTKSYMAYTALYQAFNEYRKRNKEVVGEEKEEDIYYNRLEKESSDSSTEIEAVSKNLYDSPYARLFSEYTSDAWDENPEINKNFLLLQQASANNIIQSRLRTTGYGWLYLNEVLEMLGFPMTDEGQDVGWFIDKDHTMGNIEGYVDFGINRPGNARFLASGGEEVLEQNCWLDFNCCGNIRPLMFRRSDKRSKSVGRH